MFSRAYCGYKIVFHGYITMKWGHCEAEKKRSKIRESERFWKEAIGLLCRFFGEYEVSPKDFRMKNPPASGRRIESGEDHRTN